MLAFRPRKNQLRQKPFPRRYCHLLGDGYSHVLRSLRQEGLKGYKKMERAKGFEPSTLTLAT
jgi:hypothetical protein